MTWSVYYVVGLIDLTFKSGRSGYGYFDAISPFIATFGFDIFWKTNLVFASTNMPQAVKGITQVFGLDTINALQTIVSVHLYSTRICI